MFYIAIKGGKHMTENEQELLYIIRNNDDPTKALEIAINIILDFLKQDESSQEQQPACSQESA